MMENSGDWNTAGCYTHQNNNPRTLTVSTTNWPSPAAFAPRDALNPRHRGIRAISWRVAHAIYFSATYPVPLRAPSNRLSPRANAWLELPLVHQDNRCASNKP